MAPNQPPQPGFLDAVKQFTQDQLRAREQRLQNPQLQQEIQNMKDNMRTDLYNACTATAKSAGRILGSPLIGMYEGLIGAPAKTFIHNSSVRHPRHKKQYPNVFGTMLAETLSQVAKGGKDGLEALLHLTKLTGRATALGGRYLIGK